MLRHIAVVIILIAGSFALAANSPANLTPADSRKALPGIALTDDKGGPVNLSAYKGRVVLLDFWATWCTGCKEEIPWVMEFEDKYNKTGLTVVGASLEDDGLNSGNAFLSDHIINYHI